MGSEIGIEDIIPIQPECYAFMLVSRIKVEQVKTRSSASGNSIVRFIACIKPSLRGSMIKGQTSCPLGCCKISTKACIKGWNSSQWLIFCDALPEQAGCIAIDIETPERFEVKLRFPALDKPPVHIDFFVNLVAIHCCPSSNTGDEAI